MYLSCSYPLSTRGQYAQTEPPTGRFDDGGRRVAHTMHCTADKGCVSLIFTINFQFSGNLWKGSIGTVRFLSVYICTLDIVRKGNRWPETSARVVQLLLNIGFTQWRLHEGAAQPNGGLADIPVYGNRHRGFNMRALIFFFTMGLQQKKICLWMTDIALFYVWLQ